MNRFRCVYVWLAVFLSFFSSSAMAARDKIEDVSISEVIVYNDQGLNIITVKFESDSPIGTGCTPTDAHNMVSYWTSSSLGTASNWLSVLLSAQAQGLNVDLYIGGTCNTGNTWTEYGQPYGLGQQFWGAKVVSP